MKTIYFNGKVYTGGEELQQAFVVRDGSFTYVGDSRGAKQLAVAGDELVDLQGRFVCPGFNDSHMHVLGFGKLLRPDQWEKIKVLKLHVYAQTIFLDYDINIVEQRVGKELAETSYCWKSLMRAGVSVSNGSDAPVELPDVMAGIQCAVTRKTLNGSKEYLAKEAFTVKEAIDSYTIQSAQASFEEDKKGRIQEGMHADFVILDENLFEIPKEKIKDVKVLETYLGGYSCYRRS